MEEYKNYLIDSIGPNIEEIENLPGYTINRDEYGRIHSRYIGDRYEPAIVIITGYFRYCYYLFDGDIKDCNHPFLVTYIGNNIISVRYYSSERIKNGESIYVNRSGSYYNMYKDNTIINEYRSKFVFKSNELEKITLLCDKMEEDIIFRLKFAD